MTPEMLATLTEQVAELVQTYIVPHKFMNIKSGAKLRELLSSNSSVKKILHFGTHQVFENRSTYTCILVLSKQGHEEFQIGFVQDWNRFLFNHDTECLTYPAAYISGQPWSFLPQNIVAHLEEISQSCVPLSSLVDIFVGVQRISIWLVCWKYGNPGICFPRCFSGIK